MHLLANLALAALAAGTLRHLWLERHRVATGLPVVVAAVVSALGDVIGGKRELELWGAAGALFCLGAFLLSARVRHLPAHVRGAVGSGRLVALGALVAWLLLNDMTAGLDAAAHFKAYALVVLAVGASALLVARGGISPAVGAYAGLVVVGLSDIAGLQSGGAWRACDRFKCSALHGLFRGPYPSENFLALVATVTLAWVLTATTGKTRLWGSLLCAATIAATGSRTALVVSLAVVAAPLVAVKLLPPIRPALRTLAWPFAAVVASTVSGIGVYLLFSSGAQAFSNRGEVWRAALSMVAGHHLTGVGLSSYAVFQQQGLVSYHFTHSEYLLLLFSGGYVAIALYTLWAAVTMRALARTGSSALAAIPAIALTVYGMTEVSWNPLAFDSYAWIALALSVTNAKLVSAPEPARERHKTEPSDLRAAHRPRPDGIDRAGGVASL